ncbi:MAG: nitroreductase family protein [Muribaculaceae bacterium]|nr:nitroreductase family protein [Muribaculaceae bacterium]MDE6131158.1 nitroreductase family protein [Muribaculaceae bacterium]
MNKSKTISLCVAALIGATSCSGNDKAADNDTQCDASAVIENIMTRTSVRQFNDKPVSKDTLDMLVRAGMAAPTAVNKQPWAFVVVTDRQVLDSLDAVHPHAHLAGATAAISVCGDLTRALEGRAMEYWIQDCSAATENILLAAHAVGLGAVWCGVYPDESRVADVSRVLELPDSVVPLNIITMGYPEGENAPKDKWDAAKVHYQKW